MGQWFYWKCDGLVLILEQTFVLKKEFDRKLKDNFEKVGWGSKIA